MIVSFIYFFFQYIITVCLLVLSYFYGTDDLHMFIVNLFILLYVYFIFFTIRAIFSCYFIFFSITLSSGESPSWLKYILLCVPYFFRFGLIFNHFCRHILQYPTDFMVQNEHVAHRKFTTSFTHANYKKKLK